jgi:polyphosphate kinase
MSMRRPAEFRCDLPTPELFTSLAAEPLPLGLVAHGVTWNLYRDLYLDTSDGLLASAGVACRVRTDGAGRRTLSLGVAADGSPQGAAAELIETDLPPGELAPLLAGHTEPARRLRGLADPSRLEPRLELAVERVTRDASRAWRLPGWFAFLYDRVTVRRGGLARQFQELKVRRRLGGKPRLEELAQALEARHGLRPMLQTKLQRAQALLRQMEQESLIRRLESGRAVAVLALDEGRVALLREGDERRLPISPGAGEQAVRHGLAEWLGSQVGELALLGHVPPALDRPSLEVWLARRLRRGLEPPSGPRIEWMPVDDLARAVRTSAVGHPATVAAFGVAARSALVPEWSASASAPESAPAPPAVPDARRMLDADASLLEFNLRVLAIAEDERTPLLERLRYLAIVSANLDELYMSAGREVAPGRVRELLARQQACIAECLTRLADHGHRLRRWAELDDRQRDALRLRFRSELFPLLTPRAITVSPGHPFPVIPALTLSLAVTLQAEATGPIHFAYLKLPASLPRFVELPGTGDLVPVEEIVHANLGLLYPDRVVEEAALFRVTRKGDLELDDAEAGDLLQAIEEELDQRALNPVVRLEIEAGASRLLREMLVQELRFEGGHGGAALRGLVVHDVEGLMAPGDLRRLASLPVAGGLFPPFTARDPLGSARSLWDRLRAGDLLVHHPYDDFAATVLRLLEEAADDPDVVAIRMTLYRAGDRSPVVDALVRAARQGKEVAVFVELKASWDEARNIGWVRQLERAGAQVVYGLVGLKNHAKTALVVRREDGGIRRYVHIGTGNYNPGTARLYTDLGLLSADPVLGEDLNDFFNQLTGTSRGPRAALRRVLVAPEHLLPALLERIAREAALATAGGSGRIRAKLNGLDDPEIIQALYDASRAGVEIDLVVRGLCTLRPGEPGLSERIRVRSLVGRFLEHARIYHFGNGGEDQYLIGSADWRSRNLRRRVEVVVPVLDDACRRRLDRMLTRELADPSAWELAVDGRYHQLQHLPVGDSATAQAEALSAATEEEEATWAARS